MVAAPRETPRIWGCVSGLTNPAAMNTLGVTTTEGALLDRETVTPPGGAGVDKVIGKGAGWFGPIVTLAGRPIAPLPETPATEMPAIAFVRLGAFATIDAEPGATPVTGTPTLEEPAGNVALPGTVAAGLLEFSATVKPVGVGAERFSWRLWTEDTVKFRFDCEKFNAPVT